MKIAVLALLLVTACDDVRPVPVERVGRPLLVNPTSDASTSAGDAGSAGREDGAVRGTSPASMGAQRDAGQPNEAQPTRPQPARALKAAAEGDRAAATGNLAAATASYGKALRLNPRSPWIRVAHAWYQSRQGSLTAARDDLEQALDLAERRDPWLHAALHSSLGELRELRRDRARARESYRTALRAWSAPPLARALLRLTPPDDLQYRAAMRVAFGEHPPPEAVLRRFGFRRERPQPIAYAPLGGGSFAVVTSQPPPGTPGLPAGAHYALHFVVNDDENSPDAGPASARAQPVSLGETPALRWHKGRAEVVDLGGDRRGVVSTLERTAPGAGAPLEVGTTLVALGPGNPEVVFTRVTGSERDDPLGCRRGWRERVILRDRDGDGAVDAVALTRTDFVRARLESAQTYCEGRVRTRPEQLVPLIAQSNPASQPDAGGSENPDADSE